MINIVTAFPGEARPLIEPLGLTDRAARGGYTLYHNDHRRLLISGAGKVQAAAAVGWLRGADPARHQAWLNIGIAGHGNGHIGAGLLAHRITDMATGKNWYPPQVHGLSLPTDNLLSVDRPETGYPVNCLYDMEAAGFYPVACRTTTTELVQCYKVISDNRDNPVAGVTQEQGEALIADRLTDICRLVTALERLSDRVTSRQIAGNSLARFTNHWHFTVSQRHQLERLLVRWDARLPDQPVWCDELQTRQQASQVLHWLEHRLDTEPVRLD